MSTDAPSGENRGNQMRLTTLGSPVGGTFFSSFLSCAALGATGPNALTVRAADSSARQIGFISSTPKRCSDTHRPGTECRHFVFISQEVAREELADSRNCLSNRRRKPAGLARRTQPAY